MKKIFLLIALWVFTLPLFAQNAVNISGTVTDINTGTPLALYPVTIQSDSSNGFLYYNVVYTNMSGFFQETMVLFPSITSGVAHISVVDCQQYTHSVSLPFGPGNMALTTTFSICAAPQNCVAGFTYMPVGMNTIHFINQSVGGNGVIAWDFGDGTTSNLFSPDHSYQAPGYYVVNLSIGLQGTTCWDQETMTILVDDSVVTGCQSYFITETDPVIPSLVHFINQSVGSLGTFIWNFGDGNTSTVSFPANPNVSHQYATPGIYNACLNVIGTNNQCYDAYCTNVVVDTNFSQCLASFTYTTIPGSMLIQFVDQSYSSEPISWLWNFGDPAYGTANTSTLQNPIHTFSTPGTYNVCLIISSGNCSDTICMPVVVGQNQGCQANFSYSPVPGATPNTIQFTDLSQPAGSSGIDSWSWVFYDPTLGTNNSSNLQNPVITFFAPGVYNVCLTISSNDSTCYDTFCSQVIVQDSVSPCFASFTYAHIGNTPNEIQFTDLSASASGVITGWGWDFGDGTTSNLQNPVHTYATYGIYTVTLWIVTSTGCQSAYTVNVEIGQNQGCQAFYTYATIPGTSPNVIQFTDASVTQGPVSWFWNFDDGTVSAEQNPVHTFPTGPVIDPYFVCLTISSGDSMCSSTYCLPIIPQNQGCQADFEALPAPNTPLTMNFIDQSQGGIWTWNWDFGDGTNVIIAYPNNQNISHTYPAPGFYTVCLTIQGDYGLCNSTYCQTVPVYDSLPACQAQYTYYPDSASSIGNTIQFIDLSLGNPTQWYWDFGDPASGIANVTTVQNPVHQFSAPGIFYVCLTVGGPNCQSVWCGNVVVGTGTFCVNYFTYSQIGQSVNFQGFMINGVSEEYAWDFGDTEVGTGQNIVHTYNSQGTYFVTLTTMDPATGCTYSSSQVISVGDSTIWGQVYGQVFAGNFPATQGMVFLFSVDTNNIYVPFVDISMLDSAGVYFFPMVPQGNYVIYAIPFENGYIPTYYGNVLNWQNATVVQLGNPNNPYNINLLQSPGYPGGNGTIGGQVSQGDFSGSMIDKITMLLKDSSGNTILYSQVDPSGTFTFPQLAYGTYYLYAELAGCETQAIQVIISETNPNVQVNLTLSGNSILGVNGKQISLDAGIIYPNPVRTDAQITVTMNSAVDLLVELYSISGQLIYSKTEPVSKGETIILLPARQLPDGVYILKMYTREGIMITRKLVKTN